MVQLLARKKTAKFFFAQKQNPSQIPKDSEIGWKCLPTSKRSKPIRLLTPSESSCSDEQLVIGYSLPNFQLI